LTISGSRGDATGEPEPPASSCGLQVDAGEDHGRLCRVQSDAIATAGVGHPEAADFQSLVPDRQTVMIKIELFDAIPAAVDEEEEMAAEGVLAEALPDEAREAVEALSHVDRSGAEERADGRRE
jgi:SAM-dependent MidA family methyltransferase